MNILFLDQFGEPGGGQQCLLDLLPTVVAQGGRITVAAPAGPLLDAAAGMGAETAMLSIGPFSCGYKSASDALRFAAQLPGLALKIRRLTRQAGAHWIYVNGPRILPAVAVAQTGIPVLFQSHHYLPQGVSRTLAGRSLRHLRANVAADCHFVAGTWKRYVRPDRLHVVYIGVAAQSRPRGETRRERPVIGCIGRIAPQKGQHRFVEAAREIVRIIPGAKFVIYGARLFGDPPAYEEQVRAAAVHVPVDFGGWTSDIGEALARLDLLLVPSSFPEATPRIVLEAFAARVPVAALRCGGLEELITHGRTGMLAGSTKELAAIAIDLLTADPARLRGVADAAYALWSREFTREGFRERMLRLLSGLDVRRPVCP
jgi:glycosyltransferase involved in cell wall biosynthesis